MSHGKGPTVGEVRFGMRTAAMVGLVAGVAVQWGGARFLDNDGFGLRYLLIMAAIFAFLTWRDLRKPSTKWKER